MTRRRRQPRLAGVDTARTACRSEPRQRFTDLTDLATSATPSPRPNPLAIPHREVPSKSSEGCTATNAASAGEGPHGLVDGEEAARRIGASERIVAELASARQIPHLKIGKLLLEAWVDESFPAGKR